MAFIKAEKVKTGGKFLFFGEEGTGKSLALLTFPKIAAMDSEAGLSFYIGKDIEIDGKIYNNLELVDRTADLDTLEENLDSFLDGEFEEIETFGIDSETKFFGTMQVAAMEVEENRARRDGKDPDTQTISMQQRGRMKLINLKLQQAKISLSARGTHVVSLAQEVPKYASTSGNSMKVIGVKPDMHNSVPFDYDVIIQFFKEEQNDGSYKYYGRIIKDRTQVTKVGEVIENITYDIWKPMFDGISGLKTEKVDYSEDMKKSTKSMESDAQKAETLAKEFKALMQNFKEDKSSQIKINSMMKEMEISAKNLTLASPSQLQELIDFAETLR